MNIGMSPSGKRPLDWSPKRWLKYVEETAGSNWRQQLRAERPVVVALGVWLHASKIKISTLKARPILVLLLVSMFAFVCHRFEHWKGGTVPRARRL